MPPWLRLLGLPLVVGPLVLLWVRPDTGFFPGVFSTFRPVGGTNPSPPSRRSLPNAERCVVIETAPGGIDIGLSAVPVPPARTRTLWWCDDDRVYWS